ncbi:MAG: peptidylprolyl isomerase [Actinomycetota bacterium]|nr:peptidylprolyl isomerase [Actinomycetota bacterium]
MKRSIFFFIGFMLLIAMLLIPVIGCSSSAGNLSSEVPGIDDQEMPAEAPSQTTTTNLPKPSNRPRAVIETNKGKIVIELFPDKAPNTVNNFVKLANSGFYNNMRWHRVVPGFVIQGGDPLSRDNDPGNDGTGGPGYTIKAEFNDAPHLKGTVAMARAQDPDSAGSQFYICLEPQPSLDGKYTVFGQVVEGMDVVESIQLYDQIQKIYMEKK